MSYQQVFPLSSNSVHNVENLGLRCAKPSGPLQKTPPLLPMHPQGYPYDFTEIVGKNGHPVCQKPPAISFGPEIL